MNLRKIYRTMWIFLILGLGLMLFGAYSFLFVEGTVRPVTVMTTCISAGLVTLLVGAIYTCLRLRCPHCDSSLRMKFMRPAFCPHCGNKLDW